MRKTILLMILGGIVGGAVFGQTSGRQTNRQNQSGSANQSASSCPDDCPAWALQEDVKTLHAELVNLRAELAALKQGNNSQSGQAAGGQAPGRADSQLASRTQAAPKAQPAPKTQSVAQAVAPAQGMGPGKSTAQADTAQGAPAQGTSAQTTPAPVSRQRTSDTPGNRQAPANAGTQPAAKNAAPQDSFAGGGFTDNGQPAPAAPAQVASAQRQQSAALQPARTQAQTPAQGSAQRQQSAARQSAAQGASRPSSRRSGSPIIRQPTDKEIPLGFVNALDGTVLDSAKIEIYGIGVFTTDRDGYITIPKDTADGTHTLIFSKPGFITTMIPLDNNAGTVSNSRFSISPIMTDNSYRIVLDWGEEPADLDLHFEKVNGYHISPKDSSVSDDGTVSLNLDGSSGYGPETITVQTTADSETYNAFVVDATNQNIDSSRALTDSGAIVRIYRQDQLLNTFPVPLNRVGNRWDVFRIVRGAIRPVRRVGNK